MSIKSTSTDATTTGTGNGTPGNGTPGASDTVLVMDPARRTVREARPGVTLGAGSPDGKTTAQVILFPTRSSVPPPTGTAEQRLTRALASLDAALSEQRTAMVGWRESLDHLRKATTGLGLSMQRYQRTLGKLGADVSDLHAQALRLERWADDTLAKSGTAAPRADAGANAAAAKRD